MKVYMPSKKWDEKEREITVVYKTMIEFCNVMDEFVKTMNSLCQITLDPSYSKPINNKKIEELV